VGRGRCRDERDDECCSARLTCVTEKYNGVGTRAHDYADSERHRAPTTWRTVRACAPMRWGEDVERRCTCASEGGGESKESVRSALCCAMMKTVSTTSGPIRTQEDIQMCTNIEHTMHTLWLAR
jgi:hypothetical protein